MSRLSSFLVPAWTFDNVSGKFPIGFFIWQYDNAGKKKKEYFIDAYDQDGEFICKKSYYLFNKDDLINKWINLFRPMEKSGIGFMNGINANDFQNINRLYIANSDSKIANPRGIWINERNLKEIAIYLASRFAIPATWLNDRDQYFYPNKSWEKDTVFHNDCLTYALFAQANNISSQDGENHWIPFTEEEVNAAEKFQSHFMTDYMMGKLCKSKNGLVAQKSSTPAKPLQFSEQAKSVFDAGRNLWRYYHRQPDVNVNASFYDIKEYFQKRDKSGRMHNTSEDETYNGLIADLRLALKTLSDNIADKVYEHGFLKK